MYVLVRVSRFFRYFTSEMEERGEGDAENVDIYFAITPPPRQPYFLPLLVFLRSACICAGPRDRDGREFFIMLVLGGVHG
jgi:hypothetical protein